VKSQQELSSIDQQIRDLCIQGAAKRAGTSTYILALVFSMYSTISTDFLQRYNPSITFWSNFWPRVVFCTTPFLFLALYMRHSQASAKFKLILWIASFSVIFHVVGWIHIWPMMMRHPEVVLFVDPANTFLYAMLYTIIAPPRSVLPYFILGPLFTNILPQLFILQRAGDHLIFNTLVTSSSSVIFTGILISQFADKFHQEFARLQIEKEALASRFLGPVLTQAIFKKEANPLQSIRCRGFVLSIDIRDSTNYQNQLGARWIEWYDDYLALVDEMANKCDGYIQKTIGDAHVINFGIMNYEKLCESCPDENQRLALVANSVFSFVRELFDRLEDLSKKHDFPEVIRVGAGLDKGWVYRGVKGGTNHAELDVNGDTVNCSNRLEEYSKALLKRQFPNSSILVASPFASDYPAPVPLEHISATELVVRNYQKIRWVSVYRREYAKTQPQTDSEMKKAS